jgi:hypothetical protein
MGRAAIHVLCRKRNDRHGWAEFGSLLAGQGRGHMPTGSPNDSASSPPEPDPPSGGSRRHSWLAREGGSRGGWGQPITWATAALVLLGGSGIVVLLHEPGGRPQAQSTYCGLVTCAVLRSAATPSVPAGAAHRTSPLASSPAPAPTATTTPTPKPAPSPAAESTPKPAPPPWPAPKPTPSRWPWPPWWPHPGWGHGHGYPGAHSGGFRNWPGGGR